MARVERLIAPGQDEGNFRTDLSRPWLVGDLHSLLHGAAEELDTGRLEPGEAVGMLASTSWPPWPTRPGDGPPWSTGA
jgi:TetR/AcrR family transcriptional repressor of mexCD-oprJ operon